MTADGHDEKGRFAEGNEVRLTFGHGRALKDLQHGAPLRGVCAELAQDVAREIAEQGAIEIMWRACVDHLAVSRLYLGLILAETDEVSLDKWVQRYGWLNSKAFNMLRDLVKIEGERADGKTLDGLLATPTGGRDGNNPSE